MKKLLFIAVIVISITSLKAQDSHFGVKLGVNRTNLSTSGEDIIIEKKYSDGKTGFSIGLIGDFMLSEQFAISGEINYAMAGDFYSYPYITNRLYSSYIQIPVMAKYFITENFYLNAGPQIGFLMSAVGESEYEGSEIQPNDSSETGSENIKDEFESTDFGLNIGTGYKFNNGLFLDLRYSVGLSNISKDKDVTIKNNGILFCLGYFFK